MKPFYIATNKLTKSELVELVEAAWEHGAGRYDGIEGAHVEGRDCAHTEDVESCYYFGVGRDKDTIFFHRSSSYGMNAVELHTFDEVIKRIKEEFEILGKCSKILN